MSQAVLPGMMARKSGKIIHIASLMSDLARPTVVPYTAAKGGVRQLTRGMAVELAPHGIQVNAIAPGYFATEMNRALIDNAEFNAWVCKRTPAGTLGRAGRARGACGVPGVGRIELHDRADPGHGRRHERSAVAKTVAQWRRNPPSPPEAVMSHRLIRDVIAARPPRTTSSHATVADAARLMKQRGDRCPHGRRR